MYCSKNAKNLSNLCKLKMYADQVSSHSRTLLASTENLIMPMIQFSFLFPSIFIWFLDQPPMEKPPKDPQSWISYITKHWTTILIIFSCISSVLSLVGSQVSIYFSSPEKRNQKTTKIRIFIFTLILFQVLPKLMACQIFAFGVIGAYNRLGN